jgi:hypothetical protein
MITQELKQKLHEEKNRMGLVGGSLKINEYDEAKNNVSAHINPQGWNIEISLRKGFSPVGDRRQKAYAKRKGITDGLETLLGGVLNHEIGHWQLPFGSERGCPYDVYNHDKILEAIKGALPEDKRAQAGYVTNAFEDVIDNARGREFSGNLAGQVLFWDNEGLSLAGKGQKGYTPFYEAFVKLNMHLAGDKTDVALLKRHYTNTKSVDSAVQKVIDGLALPKDIANTAEGTAPLFVRTDWQKMAFDFARHLAPLLEQTPTERLSAFDSGGDDGSDKQEPQAGNGVEQKMRSPEGKEEIAYGRYSGNERLSTNLTSFEQLDSLYKKLARDISVKVDSMTRTQSLPIAPLTYRAFDEEKDDPVKVKASRLRLTDQGLTFSYPHTPIVIASKFKMQRKSFPDFKMVVLDNSGSMKEGIDGNAGNTRVIPWGDNSKYHFALLGFYGIENFLQRQGISQYIRHGASLFSDSTRYRESDFSGLAEVRKLALSPQFGNTRLDASVLAEALRGRESLVLSLSDGEIGNWDSEKAEFEKLAANNLYTHIHLGGDTQFTRDLKSWNIPVFYVGSGRDLAHLMVDITKKQYERFTKQ